MRRFLLPLLLLTATPALAEMRTSTVEYTVGKQTFENVIVWDDEGTDDRPGLLMVPDWMGVTPENVEKAKQIAGRDYVVMVADVYGKGVRPANADEAKAQVMKMYADTPELRRRANAALETLRRPSPVKFDASRLAAFGYCFGGRTVLDLARSGADIAAAVSFHGGLSSPLPAQPDAVKASILVLNGAEDKGTAPEVAPFEAEMRTAKADWTLVNFADAVHCFALPHANRDGCRYNERAAKRSEAMMFNLLEEKFAR